MPTLTRREALRGGAYLVGTIAASSSLAMLAPSRVWALELSTVSNANAATILAFAQTLYPHKGLPTAVYALVVKDLDAAAKGDPAVATLLATGSASLNAAAGGSFASASPAVRLAAAKKIDGTLFFTKVRSTCITSLYTNEMAFKHFGYQGASWQYGGYLTRGFNDLAWLPNPPPDASPAAYHP
ncbi:MAG: tat (twin-arginine translocation) pathway signal sequence [Vulcanimicrobiaceae bacterium]